MATSTTNPGSVTATTAERALVGKRASAGRFARLSMPLVGAAVALVLLVAAVLLLPIPFESEVRSASVRGLEYQVGVARSLIVQSTELTPYGEVEAYNDPGAFSFADDTAYALAGVDPTQALVVPWTANLSDDAGHLGEYALLTRAPIADIEGLCAYFDPGSEFTPPEC